MNFLKVALTLGTPAIVFLGLGIGIGIDTVDTRQDTTEVGAIKEVTAQTRMMSDNISLSLDSLRSQALGFLKIRQFDQNSEPPAPLLYWAVIGEKFSIKQKTKRAEFNPLVGGETDFETLITQAASQLSAKELKSELAAFLVRRDPQSSAEWLALVFSGTVLVIVDPMEAFPAFKKFTARSDAGNLRSFLLSSKGMVLAHSQPSYVSSDFSSTGVFTSGVNFLMNGSRLSGAGTYRSFDKLPATAAYSRLGSLSLAVVVERTGAHEASSWLTRAVLHRLAGQVLVAFGLLVVASLGLAWWLLGKKKSLAKEEKIEEQLPVFAAPANFGPSVADLAAMKEQKEQLRAQELALRQELQNSEAALKRFRDEQEIVARFESLAARMKEPMLVAKAMAETATRLCESPTLFFTYHDGVKSAVMHSSAGFANGEAPVGLSFPIDNALMQNIMENERRGEITKLANYEPLAKLVLVRTGTAHFEAWPVTGCGRFGRLAGRPRLLGVLVILRAGAEISNRHESLTRMMRTTGLIYENAILSQ